MTKYKCILHGQDICEISVCEEFPAPHDKTKVNVVVRGGIFNDNLEFEVAKKVKEHIIDNASDDMEYSFIFPNCRAGRIDVKFYGQNMDDQLWSAFEYAFSDAIIHLSLYYMRAAFRNSNDEVKRRLHYFKEAEKELISMAQFQHLTFRLVPVQNEVSKVAQPNAEYKV